MILHTYSEFYITREKRWATLHRTTIMNGNPLSCFHHEIIYHDSIVWC